MVLRTRSLSLYNHANGHIIYTHYNKGILELEYDNVYPKEDHPFANFADCSDKLLID